MFEQFIAALGGAAVAVGAVGWLIKSFIGHRLTIEANSAVERIRAQYTQDSDQQWQRHEMRMGVLKERFRAHQKAYTLWDELVSAVHKEKNEAVVLKCQDWWIKNCLYLDPDVRIAFWKSYRAASIHPSLLDVREVRQPTAEDLKNINDNWVTIMQAGQTIVEATKLPPINEVESVKLKEADLNKRKVLEKP